MLKTTTIIGLAAAATLTLGSAAYATGDGATPTPTAKIVTPEHKTQPRKPRLVCHGTKVFTAWEHRNDNGHGSPSEWAALSFLRKVTVTATGYAKDHKGCNYVVKVNDAGSLTTIKGAGYPNGSDGHIKCAVLGKFSGWYLLKATGVLNTHAHINTTLSTSAQLNGLFHGTVTGSTYAWDYFAKGQHWKDASWNNDGQSPSAGNITGGECETPTPTPTPSDSTPEVTPTPTPTDTTPGAPDEAPPAQPVTGQPNFTG